MKSLNRQKYHRPAETAEVLAECPSLFIVDSVAQLVDLACGDAGSHSFEVAYGVAGQEALIRADTGK